MRGGIAAIAAASCASAAASGVFCAPRCTEAARSVGRLVRPVGRNLPELLDRLGVRHKGKILRAAVVLFGKTF